MIQITPPIESLWHKLSGEEMKKILEADLYSYRHKTTVELFWRKKRGL